MLCVHYIWSLTSDRIFLFVLEFVLSVFVTDTIIRIRVRHYLRSTLNLRKDVGCDMGWVISNRIRPDCTSSHGYIRGRDGNVSQDEGLLRGVAWCCDARDTCWSRCHPCRRRFRHWSYRLWLHHWWLPEKKNTVVVLQLSSPHSMLVPCRWQCGAWRVPCVGLWHRRVSHLHDIPWWEGHRCCPALVAPATGNFLDVSPWQGSHVIVTIHRSFVNLPRDVAPIPCSHVNLESPSHQGLQTWLPPYRGWALCMWEV